MWPSSCAAQSARVTLLHVIEIWNGSFELANYDRLEKQARDKMKRWQMN
jgi:hypothetical protein